MTIVVTIVINIITTFAMPHTMKAGEFKSKCLELMDQVALTGEPIVITKRGKPVARLVPFVAKPRTLRGFLKGRIKVTGDIISPIEVEWDALKP